VLDWLATGEHEQEVYVLNSEPADLTENLLSAAGWYGEADFFSHGRRKFTDIAAGVYHVCRDRKPDMVLCWPTGFANWACLGARLAGVPRLLVHAGNPPNRGRRGDWMSRYGLWPLVLLKAKVICCSDYVREQYQAIPGIPATLLHSVWNCARATEVAERATLSRALHSKTDRRPTAIMVATLERHKDHRTMFQAIPLVRDSIPGFHLLLAGDGSLRRELEAHVDSLGIRESVTFMGMSKSVPELLGSADLFVFSTTEQEGLGSVLLEAMAAGLPIIASDVPACREILENGTHGELVKPADPAALAAAILRFFREGKDDAPLSRAREFALSFTARRMMDQYLLHAGIQPDS
jgi:glycosyltransferase involved in cell wall biosynthesis